MNTALASPWDFTHQGISRTGSPTSRSSVVVHYTDWNILSEVNGKLPIVVSERVFTPPPFMGLGYLPEDELDGSGRVIEVQKGGDAHCCVEEVRGPEKFPTTQVQLHTLAECSGSSDSVTVVLGGRMSEEMVLKTLILGGWS